MRSLIGAVVGLSLAAAGANVRIAPTSILFIGNSFTFGFGSAVHFYRNDTVTDLNNEGVGGVPALFKSFTQQAGLDYDIALETHPGSGLDFHLAQKSKEIGARAYDKVVMHGFSMLDAEKPRDPAKLIATSRQMADLLRSKNPSVAIYLMATWSRADQTYLKNGAWAGQPIDAMGHDVQAAYVKAAAAAGIKTVIPVGEAFNRAIANGVADPNPYDGIEANKLNLWTYDAYHASTFGYYLEALTIFGAVTGRDPRSLGDTECSAFELGLSREQAKSLQQIAFEELSARNINVSSAALAKSGNPQRCIATH